MEHLKAFDVMAFSKGRYAVSVAKSAQDIVDAQDLRGLCFNLAGRDSDAFDPNCAHILIRSFLDNRLVGCFRMLPVTGGSVQSSYSAQFFMTSRHCRLLGDQ
jgi:putative hemolysin